MALTLRRSVFWLSSGLFLALALALLLAVGWMGAPGNDVRDLLSYLLISGAISIALGIAAVLWMRRGHGRLWLQISVTYCLGVGIALFNVFLTAQLMFISADHDLVLLVLLLGFAAVVSIALGYALSRTIAQRVDALCLVVESIMSGNLQARVPTLGEDEIGDLGVAVNRMAEQLQTAATERDNQERARRELIAVISHDLRTPLASLRALTEALSDGVVDDPATTSRYLGTMRGQIEHLNQLINDLFELAQIDAGAMKLEVHPVAPAALIAETVEAMQPQMATKQLALEVAVDPNARLILAEAQKLQRVLFNLVGNAIRHTPQGGTIRLDVIGEPGAPQAMVQFAVSDTGNGVALADREHIFERFYRGEKSRSRATGGAGLGLAIAQGIVQAHNGTIWLDADHQPGARFCFTIPVAQPVAKSLQ
jgi:signal transduction histidine kinase